MIKGTAGFSLSKKLVSGVSFIIIAQLLACWLIYGKLSDVRMLLESAVTEQSSRNEITRLLDGGITLLTGSLIFQILLAIAVIFYFRRWPLNTLRRIIDIFNRSNHSDGDISASLPVTSQDEFALLAESYNTFSLNLRKTIDKARQYTVSAAIGSANMYKVVADARIRVKSQEEKASLVFQSSSEATTAIEDIAKNTSVISDKNTANLRDANDSAAELRKVADQIGHIHGLLTGFNQTVVQLSQNSDNIRNVVTLVQEFSDQTNLLALNAAIEAARAGENGRGFAVVADEVRSLSHKVSQATGEISKNINEMSELVESTREGTKEIQSYTGKAKGVIQASSSQLDKMVQDFEQTNEQLISISSAIEQVSVTNKESHHHVSEIAQLSKTISMQMESSQTHSENLEMATEKTQELLSSFVVGFGLLEDFIVTGREWRQQANDAIEQLAKSGANIFDTNYQPVPDTNPQKYTVSYMQPFERALQPLADSFIRERKEFIYAIVIDRNGYMPTHHSHVSKPMTGNFEADLANSRHQKIYKNTRSEVRRVANTEPCLLQTYIRDTGEIISELSQPIFVNGKHWGAFLMGFKAEELISEKVS